MFAHLGIGCVVSKLDFLQIGFYFLTLFLLTPLLGSYMARVFSGENHPLRALRFLERLIYRVSCIDANESMNWQRYASSLVWLSIFGFMAMMVLQLCQPLLFFNPQALADLSLPLALNTALSFVTNTNWQAYAGENTLSYMSQALGLGVQNFLSAATGIAVLLALIRGLTMEGSTLGNAWVDITRAVVYVLLPLSVVLAILLVSQGVLQNIADYVPVQTLEGKTQLLPMGPVASQEAIKQLGSNGGGFFNTNSAHPFENPTPFANFVSMLAILLIPSSLIYMFGILARARKHAIALYSVMTFMLCLFIALSLYQEYQPNNAVLLSENIEGKETRFGITGSILWAMATTASSNGSVNAMHDSLTPLSGGLALLQMMLGEVVFGGVGSGLYGMLLFVMLTVFLSGLMVGRTPEYFGKKIESYEIQLVILAILAPSALILSGSALSIYSQTALESLGNAGPHGLSEILYAWASAASNNGSAFAGLSTNNNFFNFGLAFAMVTGRFLVIVPVLMVAGAFAQKRRIPLSETTLKTSGFTFALLLFFVILIVGALTFMPVLVLGPIAESFLMNAGMTF